mmetsp:Transcript_65632/g.173807  ORF Transcript_65632/g.173807 Transcript_65632/m.173807 type:complete len:346 (-) Transcript_65632:268-1305(-)
MGRWKLRRVVLFAHWVYTHPHLVIKQNMAVLRRQCCVLHPSWSELFKAGYKSVTARGVDAVEECSATAEMRTEGLLCMIGNMACARRDIGHRSHMSRFFVSLLRHTLSSEAVAACEALAAKFGKEARDVSCECSPRVRLGDGSVCCESGKTVLDGIKSSEKMAEGVDRLVARPGVFLGNVAASSHTCTWLRVYVNSLSRRFGDGVREMGSSRVDDIKALDLPGLSRGRTRDNDVQEFSVWGAMTEKRTRTVGTFMKAQRESENNCTEYIKQTMGMYQAAPVLDSFNEESCLFACDASRLDQPLNVFFFGMCFDWRSRSGCMMPTQNPVLIVGYGWLCLVGCQSRN